MMLRSTRIDLSAENRTALTALLNQELVLMTDLYLQTKLSHWNVQGPHFIAYHQLFDEIASHVLEAVDMIAERATTLGAAVDTCAQTISNTTTLAPWTASDRRDQVIIHRLADVIGDVANSMRRAIDEAAALGDADTADLFTEVSRQLDKDLWFVESHVN
ncbi:MAG: DNA starvation/stationary phase protection protein Dps [Sulfobacillus thermosulfidooxidans]|nr:DNA starvation/stationary phase protection protein Dps [Sulfobacillus thermotolerans]PSR35881.1 MAG: DNA starvation/stationary phase protection protein Dps [Sulfobacillus thermosulfidooxidans]